MALAAARARSAFAALRCSIGSMPSSKSSRAARARSRACLSVTVCVGPRPNHRPLPSTFVAQQPTLIVGVDDLQIEAVRIVVPTGLGALHPLRRQPHGIRTLSMWRALLARALGRVRLTGGLRKNLRIGRRNTADYVGRRRTA